MIENVVSKDVRMVGIEKIWEVGWGWIHYYMKFKNKND
jgi:hypothetical protein